MLETEPTLRELDRWKERIELSLDARQIFFLFFGCAVVACLVFVLGVMVGERVTRASGGRTAGEADPLAALDVLEGDRSAGLGAIGGAPRSLLVTGPALANQPALPPLQEVPSTLAPPPAAPVAPKVAPAKTVVSASSDVAVASHDAAPQATAGKARYTLQLSSFEELADAERFARHLTADGYAASVHSATVEGKGTWYRVRIGGYGTKREAVAAKAELEKREQLTSYVARLPAATP